MKHPDMALIQMEAVIKQFGGEDMVEAFLEGKIVMRPNFGPTKTVTLGLHGTPSSYMKELHERNFSVGDEVEELLGSISLAETRIDVDLVEVTPADLGVWAPESHPYEPVTYQAICEKAQKFGLELCPAEVAPAFRLQDFDQHTANGIYVATETINNQRGIPKLFKVSYELSVVGGTSDWWLGSCWELGRWYSFHRFLFVLPRR